MIGLIELLVILFATSNGLVCFYALITTFVLYLSRRHLSKGEDFRKLITALLITVFVGFLYATWNLLTQLNLISTADRNLLIGNLIMAGLFATMTYSAFLAKYMARKYGFKEMGEKIKLDVKKRAK